MPSAVLCLIAALLAAVVTWWVARRYGRGERCEHQGPTRDSAERERVASAILAALPDLVFRYDLHGRVLTLHAGDPADLVVPVTEQVGRTVFDNLPLDVASAYQEALERTIRTREVTTHEYALTFGRRVEFYEARIAPCDDDTVISVVRNITESHRLRQELAASEGQARATLAALPDLVFRYRRDGVLLAALAERPEELVVPADQQIGRRIDEFLPARLAVRLQEAIETALGTGRVVPLDYAVDLAGRRQWFEARLTRSGPDEVLCVARNVTDLREASAALAASQQEFAAVFDSAAAAVMVTDLSGRFLTANPAACELLGYTPEELRERTVFSVTFPEERSELGSRTLQMIAGEIPNYVMEGRVQRSDGTIRWVALSVGLLRDRDGRPQRCVGMMVDNTAQRAARTEADRAMAVLDATTDYVAILDADGRLAWANQATALLLGDGLGDSSRDPFDLLDAPSRYIFAAEALPEVERSGIWRGEVELDLGHGFTVPVSMLVIGHRDEQTGAVDHVALVARDISDVKRSQERLTHLATHDPLTGLPNRALCMDRLRHALDRSYRDGTGCAVLFCDLDGFKAVNDNLGHDAGDELLTVVAGRLADAVRSSDVVARLGGDEFVVICEAIVDEGDPVAIARRIIDDLTGPVLTAAGVAQVGTSIGVAVATGEQHTTADELLRRADEAMYQAKKAGKGRYRVHGEPLDHP